MGESVEKLRKERDAAHDEWTSHRDSAVILVWSACIVGVLGALLVLCTAGWSGLWLLGLVVPLWYMRHDAVNAREWAYAAWLYKAASVEDEEETERARIEARGEAGRVGRERAERLLRERIDRSGVFVRGEAEALTRAGGT